MMHCRDVSMGYWGQTGWSAIGDKYTIMLFPLHIHSRLMYV